MEKAALLEEQVESQDTKLVPNLGYLKTSKGGSQVGLRDLGSSIKGTPFPLVVSEYLDRLDSDPQGLLRWLRADNYYLHGE